MFSLLRVKWTKEESVRPSHESYRPSFSDYTLFPSLDCSFYSTDLAINIDDVISEPSRGESAV